MLSFISMSISDGQLSKHLSPSNVIDDKTCTLFKDEQPAKQESPISKTLLGIVTLMRDEQLENADFPIIINEIGRSIFLNFEKFSKDESSINVTDEGIVISVIFKNKSQSILSILSIFDEKIKCFNLLQFINELNLNLVLYGFIVIVSNAVQPMNEYSQIKNTESGIVISFNEIQPAKA